MAPPRENDTPRRRFGGAAVQPLDGRRAFAHCCRFTGRLHSLAPLVPEAGVHVPTAFRAPVRTFLAGMLLAGAVLQAHAADAQLLAPGFEARPAASRLLVLPAD